LLALTSPAQRHYFANDQARSIEFTWNCRGGGAARSPRGARPPRTTHAGDSGSDVDVVQRTSKSNLYRSAALRV